MTMRACWVRNIRGRWFKPAPLFLAAWLAAAIAQTAPSLTSLARAYRESPVAARRDALLRFAAAHTRDAEGALAMLVLGVTETDRGNLDAAANYLSGAAGRLPQLADYTAFHLARVRLAQQRYEEAANHADAVFKVRPVSPLTGEAALLAARAWLASGAPERAVEVLRKHESHLPQPDGEMTLASALEASGNLVQAAARTQRVYYGFPSSKPADEAAQMISRLREQLAEAYPPPLPEAMLGRAERWMEEREYRRARAEFLELANQLGGAARELAQVRAGAAMLLEGRTREARSYLESLDLSPGENDAERLYWLVRCARALGDEPKMLEAVSRLGVVYPGSRWRMEALIWAGNHYLLRNETPSFLPLFRTCYEAFPGAPRASYCHWKVAWTAYLARSPEAAALLREHLERYAESDQRPAAYYFLGRLAEKAGNRTEGVRQYRRILEEFPNHYYALQALQRLQREEIPVVRATPLDFLPNATNQIRIRRARLLASAALDHWATGELRFAAAEDGQPHVLASELARQAVARQAYAEAIRHIKAVFPGYLRIPLEAAPAEMWRLAYPIPYRAQIENYAKVHRLDVYLLAGLIRQESEFDPRAVSRAGARGLMQVMPSTGSQLSRTLGLRGFRTSTLMNPSNNLRLGAFYFRSLLEQHGGSVEAALASYNAGKTRVDAWLGWAQFEEPAEFVETIPITETRVYVQAVLRNRWMYQRIYSLKADSGSTR